MAAKKKASKKKTTQYTKPGKRHAIKQSLAQSDKGAAPGKWSARKAQLLAAEYEKQGGGYKGHKKAPQKSLDAWGSTKKKTTKKKVTKKKVTKKKTTKKNPSTNKTKTRKKSGGSGAKRGRPKAN